MRQSPALPFLLAVTLSSSTALAGFDGGTAGYEVSDFNVGAHTPARGQNLVHNVTALPATADACAGVSLGYAIERDLSYANHSWTWESPVFAEDAELSLTWAHAGDHRRFRAQASASIAATAGGATQTLATGRTIGPFYRQGVETLAVAAGQTVELTVMGRHFDRSNSQRMHGTLELRPVVCEETNQPPVCDGATPSLEFLWPVNHTFSSVEIAGVFDPDGDDVTITIDDVFQDEEVDGDDGSGATSPDARVSTITITDADGVSSTVPVAELRAERAGAENGRYYHVDFTADDGQGGSCSGTVRVGVPHNQGKNGAPVDEGPIFDSTAQ